MSFGWGILSSDSFTTNTEGERIMPVGTIDPTAFERFPLKTLLKDPLDENDQDGWVELRPLPYGMKLARRDKATKMSMRAQGSKAKKDEGSEISLENYNEWAVGYDFANCIVDHNITDQNKKKLDFSNAMAIKLLDPRVGSEIEKLINTLNEDEDEETLRDFPLQPNTSSSTEQTDSTKE